jgi:hypothetical protein
MTAETIAKTLGGRKAGSGWAARCPAHDDRTPSATVRTVRTVRAHTEIQSDQWLCGSVPADGSPRCGR